MIPQRPVLRYHGGKWKLAKWIISHFPSHRVYVESYGGAASVLLQKYRSYAEVYNELSPEIVKVFEVLRDPEKSEILTEQLRLTPFARSEFEATSIIDHDSMSDIEIARKVIFRSFAGFGSGAANVNYSTGFRCSANRSFTTPAHDWANYPHQIKRFADRLRGVVIESRHAFDVMQSNDSCDTLHYVDPPYPKTTRNSNGDVYQFEMTDDDHRDLAKVLNSLKGKVVLSGYGCELYDKELFPTWRRVQRKSLADGAAKRTEVLWMNFESNQLSMF